MKNFRYSSSAVIAAAVLMGSAADASEYQFRIPMNKDRSSSLSASLAVGGLTARVSADFGEVDVGQAITLDFQFTNTGKGAASGILPTVDNGALAITGSTCGTPGAPVTVGPGQTCGLSVSYSPILGGPLKALLSVQGRFSNSPASLPLTGSALAEAIGSLTADSSTAFGVVPLGGSVTRKFTFRNLGNGPAAGVRLAAPGPVGFSIPANSCGTSAITVSVPAGGSCSITAMYGGDSSSRLTSYNSTLSVIGEFTGSPAGLLLTGSVGAFNMAGNWSDSPTQNQTITTRSDFGAMLKDTSAERTYYVRPNGTSGDMALGFTVTGDTAPYRITKVVRLSASGDVSCVSGGVIAADGLSASSCLTSAAAPVIAVSMLYAPAVTGNHHVVVNSTSNNGTGLPLLPLRLRGQSMFNPQAAISSSTTSYQSPNASSGVFGAVTVGTFSEKYVTLANVGTWGNMSVGVLMTGATAHYTLEAVERHFVGGSYPCANVVAANKLSASPCLATDDARHISFKIRYAPLSKGLHQVTLTPTSDNGTFLGGAGQILLGGNGQ